MPAERVGRTDDDRIADGICEVDRFRDARHDRALGNRLSQLAHQLAEQVAVLRLLDRLELRAEQLHAFALQHARARQLDRHVEPGLPAERRQQAVRPLPADDLRDEVERDRFDVDLVGHVRVGHDRGRVAVDQDDFVTFFPERLASLRAGIVELRRLADDDRTGADDEDFLQLVISGHATVLLSASPPGRPGSACAG